MKKFLIMALVCLFSFCTNSMAYAQSEAVEATPTVLQGKNISITSIGVENVSNTDVNMHQISANNAASENIVALGFQNLGNAVISRTFRVEFMIRSGKAKDEQNAFFNIQRAVGQGALFRMEITVDAANDTIKVEEFSQFNTLINSFEETLSVEPDIMYRMEITRHTQSASLDRILLVQPIRPNITTGALFFNSSFTDMGFSQPTLLATMFYELGSDHSKARFWRPVVIQTK